MRDGHRSPTSSWYQGHAGLRGHVGECAIAIVLEQAVGRLRALGIFGIKARTIDQENVEPAIVVVVEKGGAAARGFKQVLVAVLAAENCFRPEASLTCDVDKLHAQRQASD